MTDIVVSLWRGMWIGVGLLVPGVIWAKAFRWPLPWFVGGVVSALGLFSGVLLLNAVGVRISWSALAVWQAGIAVPGFLFGRRRQSESRPAESRSLEWWILLPVLPMVAVAIWRALFQPLSGADVDFRWNYLAELIVSTGSLEHYPAVSAADFAHYFWPDGIAPLVASLYAWTYLVAGDTAKIWTAIPVLLQVAGLLMVLRALGGLWGGNRGGWFACALGGATMLLQFAFNLGQETGLTALGVGGMAYYLTEWERTREDGLLFPAVACAALVGLAREYGMIFPMVGLVWVGFARSGWRKSVAFGAGALFLPALWHLRNWVRTGNPFYAQDIAGIFPVNEGFAAWMRGYVATYGETLWQASGWREAGRICLLTALPAALGLLIGVGGWRGKPGWSGTMLLVGATIVCWLISVPYTAGGLFYSMRVLSPVLVIGCAWGGAMLARWISDRRYLAVGLLAMGLLASDASLRAWTIPLKPYATPPSEWPQAGYAYQRDFAREDLPFLQMVADEVSGKVLSDSAGLQGLFRTQGKELNPFWSPEFDFFRQEKHPGELSVTLKRQGYSHVLLKRAQFSLDYLIRTGIWVRLQTGVTIVRENPSYVLLVLDGSDQMSVPK